MTITSNGTGCTAHPRSALSQNPNVSRTAARLLPPAADMPSHRLLCLWLLSHHFSKASDGKIGIGDNWDRSFVDREVTANPKLTAAGWVPYQTLQGRAFQSGWSYSSSMSGCRGSRTKNQQTSRPSKPTPSAIVIHNMLVYTFQQIANEFTGNRQHKKKAPAI
jgi:hypothetical protein